jgi:hypothetical protein
MTETFAVFVHAERPHDSHETTLVPWGITAARTLKIFQHKKSQTSSYQEWMKKNKKTIKFAMYLQQRRCGEEILPQFPPPIPALLTLGFAWYEGWADI